MQSQTGSTTSTKIAEELGERKCRALPFFYVLTGCDIVSSCFNQDEREDRMDRITGRRGSDNCLDGAEWET